MKKILIVDDNTLFAKMVSDSLPADKYKVVTAENGEDGLSKLETEKPDLVLLDILMPKINGIEFLKILKSKKTESERKLPTPIIITSNLSNMDKISEAVSLGAKSYIIKSDENLQSIISNIELVIKNDEKARKNNLRDESNFEN